MPAAAHGRVPALHVDPAPSLEGLVQLARVSSGHVGSGGG
jgi:hypothetical protein